MVIEFPASILFLNEEVESVRMREVETFDCMRDTWEVAIQKILNGCIFIFVLGLNLNCGKLGSELEGSRFFGKVCSYPLWDVDHLSDPWSVGWCMYTHQGSFSTWP